MTREELLNLAFDSEFEPVVCPHCKLGQWPVRLTHDERASLGCPTSGCRDFKPGRSSRVEVSHGRIAVREMADDVSPPEYRWRIVRTP